MKAWYFAVEDNRLRYGDGRTITVGETHTVGVKPKLCHSGLHGSERLINALSYAPGPMLYRVEIEGQLDIGTDKLCGQSRTYLYGGDVSSVLREFARKQALINIPNIANYCSADDYALIVRWLETGDVRLRLAAREAAWPTAKAAAELAAEAAAYSVAESAAESARLAAEAVARAAVWPAAEAARLAANSAAWEAAWTTEWAATNDMLTEMVEEFFKSL